MEKDILFISPLLFDMVSRHSTFIEIEFVVGETSSEESVKELYQEICKRMTSYDIDIDWMFLFPVVKVRIQRKAFS